MIDANTFIECVLGDILGVEPQLDSDLLTYTADEVYKALDVIEGDDKFLRKAVEIFMVHFYPQLKLKYTLQSLAQIIRELRNFMFCPLLG